MSTKCGDRIKQRMGELGLNQADLCRKTGISKSTMSQYISGLYLPTQDKLYLLGKALHVSEAWLLGYEIETLAAHHDSEIWTQEELDEIERFKEYVRSKRNK